MNNIKIILKKLGNKLKSKLKQINYIFLTISLIHFVSTFFTDKIMIDFERLHLKKYILCKVILCSLLVAFWQFISKIIVKKDKELLEYVKYFLIYFIPMGILLVLIWPGVWYGSDVESFLHHVECSAFLYYLNYLTSIFYSIGCMLFPCPSGVIILQVICFSITASYIVKRTFDVTGGKKISYTLYIPFLLFSTLFYTFYPNRPVMVGIFYLLLISILIFDKIEKKELTNGKLFVLTLLIGVLTTWRSENLYLVGAIPLFIFLGYKLKFNIKNLAKIVLPIVLVTIIVYIPQRMGEGDEIERAKRSLPIYVNPLSCMLNDNLKGKEMDDAYIKINKVLDTGLLKVHASYTDTPVFWLRPQVVKDFDMKDFVEFKEGYGYIVINNIVPFMRARILTFASSARIINDFFTSKDLYSSNEDMLFGHESTKSILGYKIRKTILSVIEGKSEIDGSLLLPYVVVFNLLLPLLFIGIIFIYSIVKKNLYTFLMTGMLLGHTFLVFITAPAGYFMYYFNIYICGWTLFVLCMVLKISKVLGGKKC